MHRACLDGSVQPFLGEMGAKGATDLATANEIGVREFEGQSPQQINQWAWSPAGNRLMQ